MSTAISEKKQPQTRPKMLIYIALGAVLVYVIFLYTQPNSTTSSTTHVRTARIGATTTDTTPNMTPQDLAAHFPRYASTIRRDPFAPLIGPGLVGPGNGDSISPVGDSTGGSWSLTGINTVNGVLSAVLENATSGEVAFLQPGDTWKGLRVTDIDQSTIHFVNTLGQETTLTFAPPKTTAPTANTRTANAGSVPGLNALPGLAGAQPQLGAGTTPFGAPAAQPVAPTTGGGGRRGRRGGGGGGFGGFGGFGGIGGG